MMLPDPSLPWPIPMAAVALVAEREGCRLRAYLCPAGVPTIGWGKTRGVSMGMTCTQEEADKWLCDELSDFASQVKAKLTRHAEPNQLGALTSFAYNCGGWENSTVIKAHNAGDFQGAARAFSLWNKARVNGTLTVLPGLTARRAAEAALYLTPEPDAPQEPMPQAIEAETPAVASPIVQGGATTVGAGILAAIAEAKEYLGPVGDAFKALRGFLADAVGIPPSWVLPGVLIGAGIVVIRWRLAQRRGGWA